MSATDKRITLKAQEKLFSNFHLWISKDIFAKITPLTLKKKLRAEFEKQFKALKNGVLKMKSVEIARLSRSEIFSGFNLVDPADNTFNVESINGFYIIDVPLKLKETLKDCRHMVFRQGEAKESLARLRINLILMDAQVAEQRGDDVSDDDDDESEEDLPEDPMDVDGGALSAGGQAGKHLYMDLETTLNWTVVLGGAVTRLSGRADYSLWYESDGSQMATNLLIVEAKKPGDAKKGVKQCIAYMACVHRHRQELKKPKTMLYGIATDAWEFRFLKIDEAEKGL